MEILVHFGSNPSMAGGKQDRITARGGKFRVRMRVDGKRVSRTFSSEAEARRFVVEIEIGASSSAVQFGRAMDHMRDVATTKGLREATRIYYEKQFRVLLDFWPASTWLDEIDRAQIHAFVAARREEGVTGGTIRKHLAALRRLFKLAVYEGWIGRNPVDTIEPPQHRAKRHLPISAQQLVNALYRVRAVGTSTALRHADVIELTWSTALRRAELARLRVGDFDRFAGTLSVDGKTDDALVQLSTRARELLVSLTGDRAADAVLIGSENTVSDIFRRWRIALGVPLLRPHSLRAGAITHLREHGYSIDDAQNLARHDSALTTRGYDHPSDQRLRRIADGLSLPLGEPASQPDVSPRPGPSSGSEATG